MMTRIVGLVMLGALPGALDAAPGYSREVRPILSQNCFTCHGPDEAKREADTRLDIPGEADLEELVARIVAQDPDEIMPPPESAKKLKPEQIETLKKWIEAGARYEKHWAFVPPRDAGITPPAITGWSDQPIDRFTLAVMSDHGLRPAPRAGRRALIRRVTLDLTGLPPTLAEIEAFLADSSEGAYERLIDGLLARPQYGEHMAKYWLDLVRFADTNGMHHDHYRDMTPYRDWVIRSFNHNLGYDRFATWQLAGDLFPEPTTDQQIASGFNRLHLIIDRGTALPEESFTKNVVDRVAAVGTAFMGLTLQCAVCHDHKYDPITQRDFYQMSAFFNNFDGGPETGGRSGPDFTRGLQPPYINLPSPQQEEKLKALDAEIGRLDSELKALSAAAEKSAPHIKAATEALKAAQAARDAHLHTIPAAMIMKERAEIRPAHILIRGAYDQPGEVVGRDTPAFLPPMKKPAAPKTRMDLAEWLVDPANPLTARVAVNRFWQQFFGVGLVKTSEDFGAQGEWPSHPELLDYLTVQFVNSGWDIKALVRSFVLSATYQQSSTAPPGRYAADPDNRLLARGSRFRLDSESIRDQILAVSGLLNPEMYGRSVKPPQPEGLWKLVNMPSSYPRLFKADVGDKIYRRSIYSFWKRGLPPPQMTIFDAPSREACIARRERTNTPLQALVLMNEDQYFAAALHLAGTLLKEPHPGDDARIRQAYERITSQAPRAATASQLRAGLEEFRELYTADPAAAQVMAKGAADPHQQAELAAWTMLVHSLLNLDLTKTRE